jgi:hypothetical protein
MLLHRKEVILLMVYNKILIKLLILIKNITHNTLLIVDQNLEQKEIEIR